MCARMQSEWLPLVEEMNAVKARYKDLTGVSIDPPKKKKGKKKNAKPQPAQVRMVLKWEIENLNWEIENLKWEVERVFNYQIELGMDCVSCWSIDMHACHRSTECQCCGRRSVRAAGHPRGANHQGMRGRGIHREICVNMSE